MVPNWIVFIGEDGRLDAYKEWGPKPTKDINKIIGKVSAREKQDAINYMIAIETTAWR